MKTLDDLTPEIRAKIPIYKERCTKELYDGTEWANFNPKLGTEYLEKIYELANYKEKPVVLFSEDPDDFKMKFRQIHSKNGEKIVEQLFNSKNGNGEKLTEEDETKLVDKLFSLKLTKAEASIPVKSHYLYLASIYHRVYLTWYKFIQDEFNIDHKNKEILNWLYERANNNIARCYFTQSFVLVLKTPQYIKRNEVGFHNVHGAAIDWPNFKLYYVNGRKIPNDVFEKVINQTYTFEEFVNLDNEDIKAGVVTIITEKFGNEALIKFLDAKVVDEETLEHSSGHTEIVKLWKTNKKFQFVNDLNGNSNQPYAWMELRCPSTGSVYLIPTSAHFTSAVEACKYHRPQQIPASLKYDFTKFNS